MAGNVVRATLLADAKAWDRGFREAEGSAGRLESKSSKVAGAIKGFFALQAVAAVKAFADDSVRAFSEVEQSSGAVSTVFGSLAGDIEDYAKTADQSVGLSESAFKTLAATLGGQLQNMGFSMDESATRTTELIELGADMAATYGGTVSDAVSSISSLLRGERDPIEKYAVSVKDADVQARNLALGLDTSTTEAKKNADAVSALQILTEQTGRVTGQFARESDTLAGAQARANAQLENNKALVGQAIAGAYKNVGIPVVSALGEAAGEVALAFMQLTGSMTDAEATVHRMSDEWVTASSAVERLTVLVDELNVRHARGPEQIDRLREKTADLVVELGLEGEELTELLTLLPQVAREQGLSEEAQDAWRVAIERAIEVEKQKQTDLARGKGREEEYAAALRGTKDAADDTTEAIDETTTALREQFDLIDGRLDAFANLTGATRDVAEKQAAVNKLISDGKRGTPEYIEAVEELAGSHRDLRDAEIQVAEKGGLTRAEFIKQQTEMGVSLDIAQDLAREYDHLFTPREVTHRIRIHETRDSSSGNSSGRTYGGGRQHGGRVLGGTEYRVGEAGPETFVPDTSGRILPAGAGAGAVLNVTINAGLGSDPNAIARAIVEMLQRYQRSNGRLPIRTM